MKTNLGHWFRDMANGFIYPRVLTDKIGIGTATPTEKLQVDGTVKAIAFAGNGVQTVTVGYYPGGELITNGDFSSDTWWDKFGTAAITGGKGVLPAGTPGTNKIAKGSSLAMHVGATTILTVTIAGDNVRVQIYGSSGDVINAVYTPGTHIITFISQTNIGASAILFINAGSVDATIDDVSLVDRGVVVTPTNLNIDLTNGFGISSPGISLDPGLLPVGAVIAVSNMDASYDVTIADGYDSEVLRVHRVLAYIKKSGGWMSFQNEAPS